MNVLSQSKPFAQKYWVAYLLLIVLLVPLAGCQQSDGLAEVTGRVTDRQQPKAGIVVMFVPEEGGGAPAGANTDANGEYRLMYSNGKPGTQPGKHTVLLTIPEPTGKESKPTTRAGYSKVVEVAEGENTIDFDLADF
ncbi:hypothetical protein C5Y96_21600 [Blastopirellula marina]|uniref:Carboxypeptidase regulatory-like domain-containing protein n=1 Tax=Blastopirellula marina TaxID=124 RepID=A0A2S8F1J8_9BACT|nr:MULTISPECIES: carboxypeptidase-like regulatory domain-containing protein [Pirellulaceae]PQO26048.1 hypothetical protein C5Y96_21600 [Blastopirellula marina]RCS44406.1 carboxypeptidase regulatory-like domain-containing protein [Bremerella cremea]